MFISYRMNCNCRRSSQPPKEFSRVIKLRSGRRRCSWRLKRYGVRCSHAQASLAATRYPRLVQTQSHGLIDDEVGRDEPPLKRLKHTANACMAGVEAIDGRKSGSGVDKGVLH